MRRSVTFVSFLLLFSLASCDKDAEEQKSVDRHLPAEPLISGEEIYQRHCVACHAPGPGHPGTMRLAIRLGEDKSVLTERNDLQPVYVKTIVRQGIMLMPPFRSSEISDQELEALADYLGNKG